MRTIVGVMVAGLVAGLLIGLSVGAMMPPPLPPKMAEERELLAKARARTDVDAQQIADLSAENQAIARELEVLKAKIGGQPEPLWNELENLRKDIGRFDRVIRATGTWAADRSYPLDPATLGIRPDELEVWKAIFDRAED